MQPPRPVTLAQVAQRAGVSMATASKAMNERGRMSAETRARVLRAAEALKYKPNQRARSLITGRTSTVGLIMIDSRTERFAIPLMFGAEDALAQIDLSLIPSDARGDHSRLRMLATVLEQRKVDGVLIVGDNNRHTPVISDLLSVPTVYVYGQPETPESLVCLTNDARGGELVAAHLVELGRRQIAHITGPRPATSVVDRLAGIRSVLATAGQRLCGSVRYGPWSRQWGRIAGAKLLADRPDVDAIICGSDEIAAGVVEAVQASGRSVPGDVAITGYDDWDIFVHDTDPELTSVAVDFEELGRIAARELFTAIDRGDRPSGVRRIDPYLIVRGSSTDA